MAVCFLWHFPASHLGLPLAITLLCEVRTFLETYRYAPRPPGQLVRSLNVLLGVPIPQFRYQGVTDTGVVRISTAAVSSAAFFVAAPGTVAGLGPWLITRWEVPPSPAWRVAVGTVLIVAGLIPPVHAFIQFVKAGGTPMPIAPTERLVVTGFNRYVRNPMYVGLLIAILGQALLFGNAWLLLYAAVGWVITASFVHWYEEPTLVRQYGSEYEDYRPHVPAWIPRPRPWTAP